MPKHWSVWLVSAFLLLISPVANPSAQVITGTIAGVVQDESKAALPGVTVTVKSTDRGVTQVVVSDGEGRYRVPNLGLGNYRVDAELTGFNPEARTGISLTVGQVVQVDIVLKVGTLSETVEVSSTVQMVDTSKSQLSDLVNQQQIAELPLNSRSYTDLALLTPGVMTTSRNTSFSGTSGGGIRLSISGARPTNTGFYVDGLDTKDAFGRTPGSAAGTMLGVDAVREFQVLTSSFSAQYGGSGGVINAVTKSGGNVLHGNAFYFVRDDKLDAPNYFDRLGVPPFHRDQGGLTIGGPIKKDHTFFFLSYEKLRERKTATTIINTPGANLRAGITPTGTVVVNPLSAKFLAAMPLPNGIVNANGIGEYTYFAKTSSDEDYVMGKIDQQLGQNNSIFVRFTSDIASNVTPLAFPGFNVPADTKGRYLISEWNRIISSSLLNTARFSVNKSDVVMSNQSEGIDASLSFVPGRTAQQMVIPGLATWGNRGFDDRAWWLTSMQGSERLTWTKGAHSLLGGFDWLGTRLAGYSASRLDGRATFSSLNNFLIGRLTTWEFLVPGTGSDPVPKDRARSFSQDQIALYLQDDIKPHRNVTLNLGLRWEFVNKVTEKDGKISNVLNPADRTATVGQFFNPAKANFGPRAGIAWDPTGTGSTSIRGAYGLFYQPLNYAVWQIAAVQNAPFFQRAQIDNPVWPPPFAFDLNNLPPSSPTPLAANPSTPYYHQYNATVQRQLPGNTTLSASYAGSKGRNLASTENVNPYVFTVLPDGTRFWAAGTLPRVNTAFGASELRNFDLVSNYNSMQLRLSKRFGAGLQLQGSYTLSKNKDNGSETQGTAVMDGTNPMLDYGLSTYDVRHNFSFNYIYALPFFERRGGALEAILGGWQVSGLLIAQTGTPLNVVEGFNYSRDGNQLSVSANNDRPNLVAGASCNAVVGNGRDPLRYADVSSFVLQPAGTHGSLDRNCLIGPGLLEFDGSFVKNVSLGEGRRLELRLEFFNLFNRVNFGAPNAAAFTSAAGPNPSYGRITTTATTPRQGQVAVKFVF